MAGYLDKIKELEQLKRSSVESGGDAIDRLGGAPQQPTEYCEISELCELRAALLDRLRTGHTWLLDQHQRWQAGDTTAGDDAEFSRVWDGWWELDYRLRADHGFQGCIYGPAKSCPEGFPCQGCSEIPAPGVVAQLELLGTTRT